MTVQATIRYGTGYDKPVLVFEADNQHDLKREILSAFHFDSFLVDESLNTLIALASQSAIGVDAVTSQLGGQPVQDEVDSDSPASETSEDAEPQVEEKPKEPEEDYSDVIRDFEAAKDTDGLKKMWARHKDAYSASEAVRASYQERFVALRG